MTKRSVLVYGAGGHGKLVGDVLLACGLAEFEGCVDDNRALAGCKVLGLSVFTTDWLWQQATQRAISVVLGVGNNWVRKTIAERCSAAGIEILTAVHPSAVISRSARIGAGTAIMAGVVVNPDAEIGCGVILNSGAIIEHDVVLGEYSHVSTNVAIGGEAKVGAFSMLGVGASMRPRARVGSGSIVGSGSAVVGDLPDGVVAWGVPAKVVRAMPVRENKTMSAQGRG